MKVRLSLLSLILLFASSVALAQQATVKRNVNLRSDSSTAGQVLEHVQIGAKLTLLDPARQNGFFHVKAADGQQGWVWYKNIAIEGSTPGVPEQPTAVSGGTTQCDDTLWNHVYHPQRLIVEQKCIAVTGTVVDATNGKRPDGVRHEADGDTHGWLNVDPEFKNLLNAGNMSHEGGNLVFEIVCEFRVTQLDAKAVCPSTYNSPVQLPPPGSHVRIMGSYVQDNNHAKWMEIHPVTSIEVTPGPQ
ncbi:MAG TPA: SH3 domain-containing protein [Candidatus Acidoferrales bacterium]|nr:SH3 domain-containing protein [Candidatus Acidoferrales bacterium]